MSSSFKGITIHEGYNDLGSFQLDITAVEQTKDRIVIPFTNATPPPALDTLFLLKFTDGPVIPEDYKATFTVGIVEEENYVYNLNTNQSGYILLNTPLLPIIVIDTEEADQPQMIRLKTTGPLDNRPEESYLKVYDDALSDYVYTLITDICLYTDSLGVRRLSVYDGVERYYALNPEITVNSDIAALYFSKKGIVSGFNSTASSWGEIDTLTFYKIEFPGKLTSDNDGFYQTTVDSGTITDGHFGDVTTPFEDDRLTLDNPGTYFMPAYLDVYEPGNITPIFSQLFIVKQGSLDYTLVEIDGSPVEPSDTSPTIEDIETVSGITFSTAFTDFLSFKELSTVDKIRKAGPISYINDFPTDDVSKEELDALQNHVDFYSVNTDTVQNQRIMTAGFDSMYTVANAPRDMFLKTVPDDTLPLLKAAQIHEVAVQNQKLVRNLLAGTLRDLKMKSPVYPVLADSNFVDDALSNTVNSCGCDDCKSTISPFAYMMDLLKYASVHVKYTGIPNYNPGGSLSTFVTLLSNKFQQPFGTLSVDCDTLNKEFCRVRLVTEILEKLVTAATTAGSITAVQLAALGNERKYYLSLVYQSILGNAGTSYNELREVVATQPLADKITAAQKLVNRLGIPLYVPTTTTLTADRMWLTSGGTGIQQLTAVNLEAVFGFRDTQRDVLTATPVSLYEQWQALNLRDVWKTQDYIFTAYSREGVDPANDSTIKDNWKPILDPDIIGWTDFTYNTSPGAVTIWKYRKNFIDNLLEYCLKDSSTTSGTSVDMRNRILRVTDRDLVSQVIENSSISIINSSSILIPFKALSFKLNGTDTDVYLDQIVSPAIFQPSGTTPVMHYNKIISVNKTYVTGTGTTTVSITWPAGSGVIADQFSGGYAKFQSVTGTTVTAFETTTGATNKITAISFVNEHQVNLTLNNTGVDTAFTNGILSFVYETEVSLYTTVVLDPVDVVNQLFASRSYTMLSPGSPIAYRIWALFAWPVFLTAGTNYGKLKQMQQFLAAGLYTDDIKTIITDELHMTTSVFNRMMVLFSGAENYLASMYTAKRPTDDEYYELASIFINSAKTPLRFAWLKEEIQYDVAGTPLNLMLDGKYFWNALTEPVAGIWDKRLQTSPIIDPELISYDDILVHPEAKPYRDLYNKRKTKLESVYTLLMGNIDPYNRILGFTNILNLINTGATGTAYTIPGYATLNLLVTDLTGDNGIFKQKAATDALWAAFAISPDDFLSIIDIKNVYEGPDPLLMPTPVQLGKTVDLLVSGYKRKQLYPASTHYPYGWIQTEISGNPNFTAFPVLYDNVLPMKLAPGRSDVADRREWQTTLAAWNRQPFVQPDIVPPENIVNPVLANPVYALWNTRNNGLLAASTAISAYINSTVTTSGLFDNFKGYLDLAISRTDSFVPPLPTNLNYIGYFTDIKVREDNGEDIRPYLAQLGIAVTEYRYLANIYNVLESAGPLLDSEYSDIIDILIHIHSNNLSFGLIQIEYGMNLILDQDYFQIYTPALDSFPLTDLPVYNAWRSLYADRKAWKDTLETRIDREQGIKDKWAEVLADSEDTNMPLLRDALIRALTSPCELWQDAAERLAKTYFIETKDNCCVKHTRVSFALETLQGFLFALQNGIYNGFVSSFQLIAPDFVQEWLWLGSYATWRSAIFVFIYPENLLYPTLKRLQSPAFLTLAQTIQDANSFTSEDACDAAKEYQKYLDDLQTLEIICSTCAPAYLNADDPHSCCSDNSLLSVDRTFFFGQGPSGTAYWSYKDVNDNSAGAHSFWEAVPIEQKNITLLGCAATGRREGASWSLVKLYLLLFYTFMDEGKLKMGFIKKDLMNPADSNWQDEKEAEELPKYEGTDIIPYSITLCQYRGDWDVPYFVLSYGKDNLSKHVVYWYDWQNDKFDRQAYSQKRIYSTTSGKIPLTAVIHKVTINTIGVDLISFVFTDNVAICSLYNSPFNYENPLPFNEVIGVFETENYSNVLMVIYKEANGDVKSEQLKFFANGTDIGITPLLFAPDPGIYNLEKVCPIFRASNTPLVFAVKGYASKTLMGAKIDIFISPTLSYCNLINQFALVPEKAFENIQSAECVKDMSVRAANVRIAVQSNMNYPQGTSINTILRTTAAQEIVNEAYYFVPMLLALDQQNRGQFETALSWYRTVYDYTSNVINKRKIFYGLVLEQSIVNSYAHASNWLLDPLNPHIIAKTRSNAYTKYTLMNIIQCMYGYADREFTMDTIETVPIARKLYTQAIELTKVTELNLKPNACEGIAVACLDTKTDTSTLQPWVSQYTQLKQNLKALGSETAINSVVDGIAVLLNDATEDTYATNFSEAFAMVDAAMPPEPTVLNVIDFMSGTKDRANDAYRYLSALSSVSDFNEYVNTKYTQTIADISGLTVEEAAEPTMYGKIAWLSATIPDNSSDYKFNFANSDGTQKLTGDLAYQPLNPTLRAYNANLAYSNAPRFVGQLIPWIPPSFTPLVDYKFCLPENPLYQSLQLKGNLELYKIFNCRNIAGMVRELDVFAAATDTVSGMPVIGASGNLVLPGVNNFAPSQYRFKTLIDRAKQIAAQAQQMESLFLSALEKEDAENYSLLKAKQDLETAKATVKLQDLRINQANDEKSVADLQLSKAEFTRVHYSTLIAMGLNQYESQSIQNLKTVVILQGIAAAAYLAGSVAGIADFRSSIASIASLVGQASSEGAQIISTLSNINTQMASYERRAQEWSFQKDLSGIDISISNQQIKVAEDNTRIVTQEREIARLNTDHASDSLDFLQNKFTNAELYRFMGDTLERSYSYMLNLATSIARTAEGQLYFERQQQAGPFILNDYWETPSAGSIAGSGQTTDRRGLTGSARLAVDITRLDEYAFETNTRKLQMTKVISLAQNFPSEFQQFKETGVFNFELTNKFFDYDFPGHYLRLINSVKTTVVGLLPVYDSIKATLTASNLSYTVIGGTTFQRIPIKRLEVDSVALTSANNATGVFDMQPMQSELINPFEGMGVESRWEFKMPKFSNRMDYDNIADVLLTVEYTALDSYQYRYQVLQDLDYSLSFNRGFSFKNNFPDQWYDLANAEQGSLNFSTSFELKREFFPQGIDNLRLNGSDIVLYFVRADGFINEIKEVDLYLASVPVTAAPDNETTNGMLPTTTLSTTIGSNPLLTLQLVFHNTPANRELFSEGEVTDILLLVGCKADLRSYPL